METVVKWLADQAHAHPTATAWVAGVWFASVLITNGLRFAWPDYAEMPRFARFVVGCLDPLALNFWNLVRRVDPDLKGQHTMRGEPDVK